MTTEVICDKCGKVPGRYASVRWDKGTEFMIPEYRDICKECFQNIFPEWYKE